LNKLKKIWLWLDERTYISKSLSPLAKHLVPPGAKWNYVFGSATLVTLIIQIVSGVALSLMYQPTSATAYQSLIYITNEAPLGSILRGIHYFGASAMILLVGIHMIRVFLFASYKYPREVSWISGVVLLALTVGMGFTGQLLRWDNNGVWSAIVGAEQAGRVPFIGDWVAKFLLAGDTIGGATLSRFFAFHVFLIPSILFAILGFHLFLVLKNGISEPPKSGRPVVPSKYKIWYDKMLKEKGVPFWPYAVWRDIAFGLLVIVVIVLLAIFVGPPKLESPPNPANINAVPKPDWYLLWIYALFALMPRAIESYFIAFGPVLVGLVLFLLPVIFNKGERSPYRRPWAFIIVLFIVTMVGTLWYQGVLSPWSPDFNAKPLTGKIIGSVSSEAIIGADLMYKKSCLYCHKISGDGGLRGPDLTNVGNRLTESQLKIKIVNGGGNMPAFGGNLSSGELKALVTFLMTRRDSLISK